MTWLDLSQLEAIPDAAYNGRASSHSPELYDIISLGHKIVF